MAYTNSISIVINAIDNASRVVEGAAGQIKAAQEAVAASSMSTASRISSSLDSTGQRMVETGQSMTRNITLPTLVALGATAKMAYDFQNQMELLRTSAGIPQSAIAGLSDQVLRMAGETGQAPEKLAQGLYHIASAGNGIWTTAQMIDVLRTSAKGASLGMADLDSTTYALSSAMASGVKGAKDTNDMMAILNATVGAGDMKMQDLNGAISTGVLSTMATAGVSVQSFGAALATLTDNGEHADEAATRLRMSISLMTSPSSQAAKQLGALGLTAENAKLATAGMNEVFAKSGLTTTKLADDLRQPNGITFAIQDLKKHLEAAGLSVSETDAMLAKAFGGGRTDAAILTMLQNTDRMDDKFKAITKSAGDFNNKMRDLDQTDGQKFRMAWSGIQADLVKLGSAVLPQVVSILHQAGSALGAVTGWFSKLSPWQKQAVVDMALFAAAAGPALIILGTMARSIGAIIALGPVIGAFFSGFSAVASASIGFVSAAWSGMAALVMSPLAMPAIAVAAAIGSLVLVYNQAQATRAAVNNALNAQAQAADQSGTIKDYENKYAAGKISKAQETSAINAILRGVDAAAAQANGHALGTNFAPGGLSLVGENGPELVQLPTGSRVAPARQTQQMLGGNKTVHIQQFIVNNNVDANAVIRKIGFKLATA